jgi:hypothetical protein
MQLLSVNITNEGKLASNKLERLSLVEEDGNGNLDNAKLAESTKFDPPKKGDNLTSSNQSYSPPSA